MKTNSNKNMIGNMPWNEAIRKRPGMFIGSIDNRGLLETIKFLIGSILNSTKADIVTIQFKDEQSGQIRFENITTPTFDNIATNHLPRGIFSFAIPSINALSHLFKLRFKNENKNIVEQIFRKGKLVEGVIKNESINCQIIELEYSLDEEIWKGFRLDLDFALYMIKDFAYLHSHVKFKLNYQIDKDYCQIIYHFKNGLRDRIDIENWKNRGRNYFETHFKTQINGFSIEVAFAFMRYFISPPFLKSYANNYNTDIHGTHVDVLLKGLADAIKRYLKEYELTEKYNISEKGIKKVLVTTINIKLEEPIFKGSSKSELGNPEITDPISNYIANLLFRKMEKNENDAKELISNFEISE